MDWILSLAAKVRTHFQDKQVEELVREYLDNTKTPVHSITTHSIINDNTCPYFIISSDPKQVFYDVIDQIRNIESDKTKALFRPITIITKLANNEFILDINGERMIYGIRSGRSNDELVKSMISRSMYSVKNYFDLIDPESNLLKSEMIEEISLRSSLSKTGGRKKKKKSQRVDIKVNILSRLISYVKSNQTLMNSLVYLNTMEQIDNHALDMIYSDYRSKDAVMDYLKLLVEKEYANFAFEYNPHKKFFIPYDFRLRKLSCLIKNKQSGQNIYLVNLYNSAMYDPIPCYRLIDRPAVCQMIAHPLTKLRFLYLDLYLLNSKPDTKNELNKTAYDAFELMIHTMISDAYNELTQVSKTPFWLGVYRDENFERNQENMKQRVEVPFETIII